MDVMEALRTRHAVREYIGAPVDRSVLQELIEAAALAPSAMNRQPWAFAVVEGSARLHALSAEVRHYALEHLPPDTPLARHLADAHDDVFHGAAALVVVCALDGERQSTEDCCLAGEALLLAAHGRGLGSCWIGVARPWLNEPSVKARLGISADLTPVAPIIIGHRRSFPGTTPRRSARITWCQ